MPFEISAGASPAFFDALPAIKVVRFSADYTGPPLYCYANLYAQKGALAFRLSVFESVPHPAGRIVLALWARQGLCLSATGSEATLFLPANDEALLAPEPNQLLAPPHCRFSTAEDEQGKRWAVQGQLAPQVLAKAGITATPGHSFAAALLYHRLGTPGFGASYQQARAAGTPRHTHFTPAMPVPY